MHDVLDPVTRVNLNKASLPRPRACAQAVETAAIPAVAKAAIREQLTALQKRLIEQAKKAGAAAKVSPSNLPCRICTQLTLSCNTSFMLLHKADIIMILLIIILKEASASSGGADHGAWSTTLDEAPLHLVSRD